jgi:two-component system response regulator TctD
MGVCDVRVLLVEDNLKLAESLKQGLGTAGMVVDAVGDGLHADQLLCHEEYDVVVLDLSLPGISGLEVLRRTRTRSNGVPVLILTASGETEDRVHGLNAGADDYLPKPFDLAELVARLRAIARRRVGRAHPVFECGRLRYDTVSRVFSVDGDRLSLPPREHAVLEFLVAQPGSPVSKQLLCNRMCTLDEAISPEAIDIYIHRLRKRLEGAGVRIRTLRGLGYLLESPGHAPA